MGIGKNIKKYRQELNMTQEKLAELLNISVSAVSQWESEKTIPDISLIPTLCNLFHVSSDVLLDINIQMNNEEIEKIVEEASTYSSRGKNTEAEKILSMGLLRFPNSYRIMTALMYVYYNTYLIEEDGNSKAQYRETIISLANRITSGCTDGEWRASAIQILCYVYADEKEYDKAKELADKMPSMACCRESMLGSVTIGSESLEYKQSEVLQLIQRLGVVIATMNVKLEDGSDAYSMDERAMLREKQIAFIKLMFENEDYGFFNEMLSRSIALQAQYFAIKKEEEKALIYLTDAMKYALSFQSYAPSDRHTSLLLRNYEYGDFITNSKQNQASYVLEIAKREDFHFLKNQEKYIEVINALEKESGSW